MLGLARNPNLLPSEFNRATFYTFHTFYAGFFITLLLLLFMQLTN